MTLRTCTGSGSYSFMLSSYRRKKCSNGMDHFPRLRLVPDEIDEVAADVRVQI